jgi:hypothetical protein
MVVLVDEMTKPYLPTMSMHLTADDCDADTRNQLVVALKRIEELEASLEWCLEYFSGRYDVVDGPEGGQFPNEEMQIGCMIQETLHGPGNF